MYIPGWRRFLWRYIAGPAALIVCLALAFATGPRWDAHHGGGRAGTWTAAQVLCSHHGCGEVGDFRSADGTEHRDRVQMAGSESAPIGSARNAVDSGGDEVYPPGDPGWWHEPAGAAVAGIVAAAWLWTFPVRALRRRRAHQAPA
ncbi:hypothetical protein [Streptomyces sp. NBC_01198]|uniref:hypothetical protein n=1 Tax=Streptomyces sp. NBC_01198 TaxID=2903769 RepID=UPI002E0EC728|nr:hypothetical protein OG702_29500 [Streptomyces sp. NBC_01198]